MERGVNDCAVEVKESISIGREFYEVRYTVVVHSDECSCCNGNSYRCELMNINEVIDEKRRIVKKRKLIQLIEEEVKDHIGRPFCSLCSPRFLRAEYIFI